MTEKGLTSVWLKLSDAEVKEAIKHILRVHSSDVYSEREFRQFYATAGMDEAVIEFLMTLNARRASGTNANQK